LLKSSTLHANRVVGHADRVRRKAPQVIERADESELAWLTQSSGLLVALMIYFLKGDRQGFAITLDLLSAAGWVDTIFRVSGRIEASLRSNFPPAEGPLSRAGKRLLRKLETKK
jgi:hypothetical protein